VIIQGIETTVSGPLFERPNLITFEAVAKLVQRVVERGEQRLDKILRPRPAGVYLAKTDAAPGEASTGHYRRNISGQSQGLRGRIDDSGVVYGPWLEGVSSRNARMRWPGYASFRKTTQWMDEQVPIEADKMVRQLAKRMNR
jgi:hypothetical protein